MTDFITNLLKNLGCFHLSESESYENIEKNDFKDWKLYLKEYDMFSAMTLYNDKLKKDISYILNINESIFLLDNKNEIFLKLEYITNNENDNCPILVLTDDYNELYEKVDKMEKIYDKNINGYYIGEFNIKKCSL